MGGHALKWRGLVMPALDDPACGEEGVDPELFFALGDGPMTELRKNEARAVCFGCPAKMPCLRFALQRDMHGMWGGTTQEERRAHQERAAEIAAAHRDATQPGPAKLTRAEQLVANRRSRSERLAADPTLVEHGKPATYKDWGCHCPPCRGAWTAHRREMRERKRAVAS